MNGVYNPIPWHHIKVANLWENLMGEEALVSVFTIQPWLLLIKEWRLCSILTWHGINWSGNSLGKSATWRSSWCPCSCVYHITLAVALRSDICSLFPWCRIIQLSEKIWRVKKLLVSMFLCLPYTLGCCLRSDVCSPIPWYSINWSATLWEDLTGEAAGGVPVSECRI